MKRVIVGVMIVVAFMFSLSVPTVFAQDMCVGDFDYDGDCDGTDATTFKSDFSRGGYNNPCPPDGPAPVTKTGQTTSYEPGDDGGLQKGVAWPNPRFTDNGNGTVTDNFTGLIWLKNANCFGTRTWNDALSDCNGLASGSCGLTDGSNAGDWRLPNRRELFSLISDGCSGPAVPNTAGTGRASEGDPFISMVIVGDHYWSSTTDRVSGHAWGLNMYKGYMLYYDKTEENQYVWPVRGGH